jgi:hypothetical protein
MRSSRTLDRLSAGVVRVGDRSAQNVEVLSNLYFQTSSPRRGLVQSSLGTPMSLLRRSSMLQVLLPSQSPKQGDRHGRERSPLRSWKNFVILLLQAVPHAQSVPQPAPCLAQLYDRVQPVVHWHDGSASLGTWSKRSTCSNQSGSSCMK